MHGFGSPNGPGRTVRRGAGGWRWLVLGSREGGEGSEEWVTTRGLVALFRAGGGLGGWGGEGFFDGEAEGEFEVALTGRTAQSLRDIVFDQCAARRNCRPLRVLIDRHGSVAAK